MNQNEKSQIEKPTKELSKEIERKFTIKQVPENLNQYSHDDIRQGYIHTGEDDKEFRLRQKGDKYYTTFKEGFGVSRFEDESGIDKDRFETMWPLTKDKRIEKTRYYIPYNNHTIELDVYKGENKGLMIAEVEFDTEDEAKEFIVPDWFDQDVTSNPEYKNKNLSKPEREIFDLENGLEKLVQTVEDKMKERDGTIIVEIAGGSASGKTSAVSAKLKDRFGDEVAMIFSMDDYYRGRTYMAEEAKKGNILNFDQPEVINIPLVREHISALRNGQSIQKPVYSFKEGEAIGTEEVKPKRIMIVEGLFALNDELINEADVKVFVDIGTHGRILRRLLRDVERTGQKPEDILNYFAEVVEPMHDKYVQSTAKNADITISNEYNPNIEADRAKAEEIQVKFSINPDYELLRKIGAERLISANQIDIYYNPKDRDLSQTGESLRIREESGHKVLTYKGPKKDGVFRQRPKFEFEIDDETERKFLSIYGDKVKIIKKQRSVYKYKNIVFTIDEVKESSNNGADRILGDFIEIRLPENNINNEDMNDLLNKLSLNKNDSISKSYLEM